MDCSLELQVQEVSRTGDISLIIDDGEKQKKMMMKKVLSHVIRQSEWIVSWNFKCKKFLRLEMSSFRSTMEENGEEDNDDENIISRNQAVQSSESRVYKKIINRDSSFGKQQAA